MSKALTKTKNPEIVALVDRGAKLAAEIKTLERKEEELDFIKVKLRTLANGRDIQFEGTAGAVAKVEQKNDTIARVVPAAAIARVIKLAGDKFYDLFTFHPAKGAAQSFELNALRALPKKAARALLKTLTVEATPWVRFS